MFEGLNLSPILIPLAALLAGWAIGFFDSNLRTSKKIKQAEDSAQAAIKEAEKKIAETQAQLGSFSAPEMPVTADDPGLMRLKNENERLILELDGARVDPAALTPEERKRLIELLNTMRPWLEGKPAPTPPPPPQPTPAVNLQQNISTPSVSPATRSVTGQPQTPVSKPLPASKKKDTEADAVTGIVEQINQILQARILNTSLANRGVSLMESITGGVNVYIGINKYDGIDAVPDEEVKAAIRAAIAEWEKKYTPGL